jgi:hypothetical protein
MNGFHYSLHRWKAFFVRIIAISKMLHLDLHSKTKDMPLKWLLLNFYFYAIYSPEITHSSIDSRKFQNHSTNYRIIWNTKLNRCNFEHECTYCIHWSFDLSHSCRIPQFHFKANILFTRFIHNIILLFYIHLCYFWIFPSGNPSWSYLLRIACWQFLLYWYFIDF